MKDRVVHNNTKINTNKKAFQSNSNRPLTERCMAYIVNKFQEVGVGAGQGGQVKGFPMWLQGPHVNKFEHIPMGPGPCDL